MDAHLDVVLAHIVLDTVVQNTNGERHQSMSYGSDGKSTSTEPDQAYASCPASKQEVGHAAQQPTVQNVIE